MDCYWDDPDTYSHHIVAFEEFYDYEQSCYADYPCECAECSDWYCDQEAEIIRYNDWMSATHHITTYLNHQYNHVVQTVRDGKIPF